MLTQIEDHPPSYDEVSSVTSASNNPCNELAVSSASLSQTRPEMLNTFPQQHNMRSHLNAESSVVVMLEQQR